MFPCSDFVLLNFFSADSRITSGRNQKFVSLLLISSSSRPNLLCFGFDLNQSQRTIPISRNGYQTGLNNIQGKEVVPKYGFCPLFLTGSKQLIRGLGGFFIKKKTVCKNVGYQI